MICTKKHPLIFKLWAVWLCWVFFVNINKLYDMPQLHDYKEENNGCIHDWVI
jgi:hypothetical protein